jgi:hypothetical protein
MNGDDVKTCEVCGRSFHREPRLAGCWQRMRYCGPRCRGRTLDATDRALEHAILGLLACRAVGGTISPAEAARLVADGGRWWRLVERAHWAARRLTAQGSLQIIEGGAAAGRSGGPIRLRLPGGLSAVPTTAAV